jgi:hypothetical protein
MSTMNTWRSGWRLVVLIIGFALLVLLVMDFNTRMSELRALTAEHERVSVQVTDLFSTQCSYETAVANATAENAVLVWAYTHQHMVKEGDTLIIPVEVPGSVPTPIPTPTPTPEVIQTWQVWVSLFVEQP